MSAPPAAPPAPPALEWPGDRVRSEFIRFFESKGHTFWPSSAVVPHADPTLLFANAGMNQYKPIFLGTVDPHSGMAKLRRATNAQKCIRAGGKHNDLDDVGRDNYHHTFFEMLGNWSFGDYFKAEAIEWAWELLTQVYKIPADRLYATYFGGDEAQGLPPDEEARELWLRHLPAARVLPFGCKENFWEMGETGPCGPCTEIHYDRVGGRDAGGMVNSDDHPEVLELWNLVFIQFNREDDGSLRPLPARHVDTGAGLERIASVLQGQTSNYATDLFAPLFDAIQAATGAPPYTERYGAADAGQKDVAYRVVADHIRTLCFAIADGARVGAEGREYVLRRVLRRAVRYGKQRLGAPDGFFSSLVPAVVAAFGGHYAELAEKQATVTAVIREEEDAFSRTLAKGIERFKKMAAAAVEAADGGAAPPTISGADAFLLWDTYGFPLDITLQMAGEESPPLGVDTAGFQRAMFGARALSRAATRKGAGGGLRFEAEATAALAADGVPLTDDAPKYGAADVDATLRAVLTRRGYVASTADAGDGPLGLVLDRTSFYAEAGGQVGDTGTIEGAAGAAAAAEVADCISAAGYVLHVLESPPAVPLAVGDAVRARVDYGRRARIAPNHTFTHVLNHALRAELGPHVEQKGSVVQPERLRFDFSHSGPAGDAALAAVEAAVRGFVDAPRAVYAEEVPLEAARGIPGVRAMFGETYPDPVRVVSVGAPVGELLAAAAGGGAAPDVPVEFCGGTHLADTGAAGGFAILSEEGIAKGVRRVVAVTGAEAAAAAAAADALAAAVGAARGAPTVDELNRLKEAFEGASISVVRKQALRAELAEMSRAAAEAAKAAAAAAGAAAAAEALAAAGAAAADGRPFLVARLGDGVDGKALADAYAAVAKAHPALPALLLSAGDGRVAAFAGVPKDTAKALPAGEWLKPALEALGGRGGGKPTAANGTGPNVDAIGAAAAAAEALAALRLK